MKYLKSILFFIIIAPLLTVHPCSLRAAPQEGVSLDYWYINKKPMTGGEKKLTFYKEMLPGGILEIAGKGSSKNAPVIKAEISTDGKETWKEAPVAKNGTFRFSVKADMGTSLHIFVRITDAKGMTNDVDAAYREVVISKTTVNAAVRETLDGLMDAFMSKDTARFMSYFSEDYVGDKTIYDRRARRRLSRVNDIDIRYSINNITSGDAGKISTSFNFNRRYTSVRTSKTFKIILETPMSLKVLLVVTDV